MSTTAADIISKARAILNDTSRWSDSDLLVYVIDAHNHAIEKRPDFLLAGADTLLTETPPSATSSLLQVPDRYAPALADWVAYLALSEDNSDTENLQRAAMYRDRFYQRLVTGVR